MISFFNKHKKTIFTITVIVFIVGIFFGMGALIGHMSFGDTVAKVGNGKISYELYQKQLRIAYNNITKSGEITEVNELLDKMIRQEVFKEMVITELLKQEAQKLKMGISNFEVAIEIANTPFFMIEGRFDPRLYVTNIWSEYRMTPKEYEEWRKKERLAMKLKQFIYNSIKLTEDEVKFYASLEKNSENQKEKLYSKLKQEKFIEVANYYLKELTSKIEIKDYRKKFETETQG